MFIRIFQNLQEIDNLSELNLVRAARKLNTNFNFLMTLGSLLRELFHFKWWDL